MKILIETFAKTMCISGKKHVYFHQAGTLQFNGEAIDVHFIVLYD